MPWVRLDDHFDEHPKFEAAGPLAGWLFVVGLAYAGRNLTDGFIPTRAVARLANWEGIGVTLHQSELFAIGDDVTARSLAAQLVALGLWEIAEGGYQVHDYLHYQPSREQVLAERERGRQRQAAWRERHNGTNAGSNAVTNAGSHTITNGDVTMAPYPVPVPYPDPEITPKTITPKDPDRGASTEAQTAAAVAPRPEPTPRPRVAKASPGPSLEPLVDALAALGLAKPPLEGGEAKAAQTLLKHFTAEEIAACWQDVLIGEWGDVSLQQRLSFKILLSQQVVYNWRARRNGTAQRPARAGPAKVPRDARRYLEGKYGHLIQH